MSAHATPVPSDPSPPTSRGPLPPGYSTGAPRRAWFTMARTEARLVTRDTAGLLLPIALPPLFMVMNASGGNTEPAAIFDGLSPMDAVIVPGTLVMIVAMLGIINVPSFLAGYRQHGVLRRLSATPARPAMVLVSQVVVNLALGLVGMAIALAIASLAFGIDGPRSFAWAGSSLALGALALYATGLLVAAVARTANAALAIGLVAFFAMMASGGGMLPSEMLPSMVTRVGQLLPYGAALQALRDGWAGQAPSTLHLGVMLVAAVVGPLAASRVFRWQ